MSDKINKKKFLGKVVNNTNWFNILLKAPPQVRLGPESIDADLGGQEITNWSRALDIGITELNRILVEDPAINQDDINELETTWTKYRYSPEHNTGTWELPLNLNQPLQKDTIIQLRESGWTVPRAGTNNPTIKWSSKSRLSEYLEPKDQSKIEEMTDEERSNLSQGTWPESVKRKPRWIGTSTSKLQEERRRREEQEKLEIDAAEKRRKERRDEKDALRYKKPKKSKLRKPRRGPPKRNE